MIQVEITEATWFCKRCGIENNSVTQVVFKDKTEHYEKRCCFCETSNDYIKKNQQHLYLIKYGTTKKSKRNNKIK